MKYIILVLLTTQFCIAQNNEVYNNNSFFSNNTETEFEDNENDESTIPPVNPPTPINDYLPLLAVAAVGLGFYYRKELNQITK